MSRRAAVALAVVVVLAVAGLAAWRLSSSGTPLSRALALVPAETSRSSWTDWEGVRRELGSDVGRGSSAEEVDAFVSEAFGSDLTSMSALGTSAGTMQELLGLSPATLSWELLAQSDGGAVEAMGVGDDLDLSDVADRLADAGWTEPEVDDGVWVGGPDVLARLGSTITPELQHLVLLRDQDLVLASDQVAYLEAATEVARGTAAGADDLADLATGLAEPLAAAVFTGDYTCERLAMAQADADAQDEAAQLVAESGGVHPLTGFAMGLLPGGHVRALLQVEDADDAPADADARARLASGPAPGQGGEFTDRFALERAGSQGRVITLDLRARPGAYVLSDLTSGPVLFATC
ncbi:hypothetical protein [Nocardioides hwasunensis]|uniref:DUF3352 domain-containing protein n=1 Tax=Nocardioides hwasunensis TaxID=397258 RepID=A0ABR8MLA9_9ACTN|nr:hypothetical protein [Nocardioides hwasunensis]MBD3916809.1 hypothetical protein [Nocardioides hwasunensis]